jgi:hypothetical protein
VLFHLNCEFDFSSVVDSAVISIMRLSVLYEGLQYLPSTIAIASLLMALEIKGWLTFSEDLIRDLTGRALSFDFEEIHMCKIFLDSFGVLPAAFSKIQTSPARSLQNIQAAIEAEHPPRFD